MAAAVIFAHPSSISLKLRSLIGQSSNPSADPYLVSPGITTDDLHHATCILETVEWNAEIAYKEAVFQGLGLLQGYRSKGVAVEG